MKFINCMDILKFNRFHVGFIFGMEMQFFGNFWSIPIVLIREWCFPDYPTPKHFIFDVYRLIMTLTTKQWADLNRKKRKTRKKERTMQLQQKRNQSFCYPVISLCVVVFLLLIYSHNKSSILLAMGCECTHVDI